MRESVDLEMPDALEPFAARLFSRFPEVLLALGQPSLVEDFELPPSGNSCTVIEETGDYKLVQVLLGRRGCRSLLGPNFAQRRGTAVTEQNCSSSRRSRGAHAVATMTASATQKSTSSKSAGQISCNFGSASSSANVGGPSHVSKTRNQAHNQGQGLGVTGLRNQHSSAISVSSSSVLSRSSGPRSQNGATWRSPPNCGVEQIEYPVGFGLSTEVGSASQESPNGDRGGSRQRHSLGTVFRASGPSQPKQGRQRSHADGVQQEASARETSEKAQSKHCKRTSATEVSEVRAQGERESPPETAEQAAHAEVKKHVDTSACEKDRASTFEVSEVSEVAPPSPQDQSPELSPPPIEVPEPSSPKLITPPKKHPGAWSTGDSMPFQEAKSVKTDPGPTKQAMDLSLHQGGSSGLEDDAEVEESGQKKSPRRYSAPVVGSSSRASRAPGEKRTRDSKLSRMPEPESPRSPGSFRPWDKWD
mmetsp:Transcript_103420/g.163159  ORF Transcript_103420/g.163159 Transcript_103420/m.163159 type:complete len:475 (+) Transcript_103420:54-1478(+)